MKLYYLGIFIKVTYDIAIMAAIVYAVVSMLGIDIVKVFMS